MTPIALDRAEQSEPISGIKPHERHRAIDGWRAVAASAVVFAHAINYRFSALNAPILHQVRRISGPFAELGVQLFFVISGYIITSLLMREQSQRGAVGIAAFYARRVCRIMPPLIAYYIAVITLVAGGLMTLPSSHLLASAMFTCNIGFVDCDWWVAHTWSLAVEEQFYLFWPLLFGLIAPALRPRTLSGVIILCAIGALAQRGVFHSNFTSFGCISAGALYATSPKARAALQRTIHPFAWVVAVAILLAAPLTPAAAIVPAFLPLLVTYVIFAGNGLGIIRQILESRPFQLVGLGSYSLYLWQQLFFATPVRYATAPPPLFLLPFAVMLSVFLLERPFIKLGRRISERLTSKTS